MQTELEMAKIYTANSVSFSRKIEGDCTQGSQDPVEPAKKLATFTHFKLAKRENWCHIATRVEQIACMDQSTSYQAFKNSSFFNLYI